MRVTVHTLAERPELARHNRRLHWSGAWPRFLEDAELNPLFDEVVRGRDFADFQLGLWDERGRVVAVGDTVPFHWDGTAADLPHRISEVVARGIADRRRGRAPNAMSALAAVVDPRVRGHGTQPACGSRDEPHRRPPRIPRRWWRRCAPTGRAATRSCP